MGGEFLRAPGACGGGVILAGGVGMARMTMTYGGVSGNRVDVKSVGFDTTKVYI